MPLIDSRRLTGPGLLLDRPGAVVDVQADDDRLDRAITVWREAAGQMLKAVGWRGETLAVRRFRGGASLAFTAPPDALYAATELNEWAWAQAEAALENRRAGEDAATAAVRLRAGIEAERNPALMALREAAHHRGVTFLSDEELVSVGSGTGVRVWRAEEPPRPDRVPWLRVHDVPVALVTGSNGKTTVSRLLAAMAAEAGLVSGFSSTEGVVVGGELVGEGDFSGPEGARLLLRRPEVQVAILETARGGLLRRGLAVERANAAVVTNIAADHLGEFGIQDLAQLAETKLLVTQAVGVDGRAVLNADDSMLVRAASKVTAPIAWFTLNPANALVRAHLASGGAAAMLDGDVLILMDPGGRHLLGRLADTPLTMGGAARHNVANALAAIAAAPALGIPLDSVEKTLRRFGRDPSDNPGRANIVELGGVRILIDYVHNPHGMAALAALAESLPSRRRLVMVGQAGDRDDQAIRELARSALALKPDRVVVKEMDAYLRGRQPGEVPGIMADELRRAGMPAEAVVTPGSELPAARDALAWAEPGDLLVLALHQDRAAFLDLLERLREGGWRAGDPLPETG